MPLLTRKRKRIDLDLSDQENRLASKIASIDNDDVEDKNDTQNHNDSRRIDRVQALSQSINIGSNQNNGTLKTIGSLRQRRRNISESDDAQSDETPPAENDNSDEEQGHNSDDNAVEESQSDEVVEESQNDEVVEKSSGRKGSKRRLADSTSDDIVSETPKGRNSRERSRKLNDSNSENECSASVDNTRTLASQGSQNPEHILFTQSQPDPLMTSIANISEENDNYAYEDLHGRPGYIKSIRLINFMCHDNFFFEFSPRVNVIHGENGSKFFCFLLRFWIFFSNDLFF